MSELETGDEIAILSSSGYIETAVVGRLKIEMRPFSLSDSRFLEKRSGSSPASRDVRFVSQRGQPFQ